MLKIKDFNHKTLVSLFSLTLRLFIIPFLIYILALDTVLAQPQTIAILKKQINTVQRAIIDYERVNPQDPFPPTIDKLVYENYLPPSNDIGVRNGVFHLYTLWGGEITILAYPQFFLLQVSRLPRGICQRLVANLKYSSPLSGCQGDVEDPLDWQLRIPVGRVLLFRSSQNAIESIDLPLFLRKS